MNWKCKHTWKRARINTLWCLLGCSIGDFGTIFYFQNIEHDWSTFEVMSLALVNGLLTSIVLETIILLKQMSFKIALKTALGMSFISMIGMELAMNIANFCFAKISIHKMEGVAERHECDLKCMTFIFSCFV